MTEKIAGSQSNRVIGPVTLGLFLGALLGFAMRPSVLLIGQLPFGVVITRGTSLTGVDQIFAGVAARSFSMLLAGAAIGGLVGWALAAFIADRGSSR